MKGTQLGNASDLVKRFFIGELVRLGYQVEIDPLPSGDWSPEHAEAHRRLLVGDASPFSGIGHRTALFLDPDTGLGAETGTKHVSFNGIASRARKFTLVVTCDQAFDRRFGMRKNIDTKLEALRAHELHGLYYGSDLSFMFASLDSGALAALKNHLVAVGIPAERLFDSGV